MGAALRPRVDESGRGVEPIADHGCIPYLDPAVVAARMPCEPNHTILPTRRDTIRSLQAASRQTPEGGRARARPWAPQTASGRILLRPCAEHSVRAFRSGRVSSRSAAACVARAIKGRRVRAASRRVPLKPRAAKFRRSLGTPVYLGLARPVPRGAGSYNVPVRRDLVLVLVIAAAAFGIRTYPAWNSVFTDTGVKFLGTDAWYHIRLTEYQVRNYPWRVTNDPYAAPGGQFVPIAPFFDAITATVVVALHGRDATTADVERIAAVMPPLLGALAILVAWALARTLFDRRAGLLAACLLTVLPGHFLDRTMLGFVDHHALEALLALATLLGFARALTASSTIAPFLAGAALGLYLLAWGSGAFLVGILGVWLVLALKFAPNEEGRVRVAAVTTVAAVTALVMVVAFQDPAMHRYGSQVLGLVGLATIALAATWARGARRREALAAVTVVAAIAAAAIVSVACRISSPK